MVSLRPLCVAGVVCLSLPAFARTLHVGPGQSIQAAVDQAKPGDTISVAPGVYREAGRACPTQPENRCAVVVTEDDIALVGRTDRGRTVVLENAGGQDTGIAVARSGASGASCLTDRRQRLHGATVRGFTVKGFGGNGILLFCVDRFVLERNSAHDNLEYGVFPSHCGHGRVIHNVATGSNDTGIYVGQSHDVWVEGNLASGNVSGFEVENSHRVAVVNNVATGNTAGILSFTLPFLDVTSNSGNLIEGNVVVKNNKPNTCVPGDTVCLVPAGTGILLLAANRNVVRENLVVENGSLGIAVTDFCAATNLPADQCALLPIDPFSSGDRIEENTVLGNGRKPDPDRLPPGFASDLFWSGTGTRNCWSENLASVIVSPTPLPTCRSGNR